VQKLLIHAGMNAILRGENAVLAHCADLGAIGVWADGTSEWIQLGVGFDANWTLVGCGDFDGDPTSTARSVTRSASTVPRRRHGLDRHRVGGRVLHCGSARRRSGTTQRGADIVPRVSTFF